MPRGRLLALLLAGLALVAPATAPAKQGVVARLDRPLPFAADAGRAIVVGWTLTVSADGVHRPVSALGVFVRLQGEPGSRPSQTAGREDRPGHYTARVIFPKGGIWRVAVGVHGTACRGEPPACELSAALFPLLGPVLR
jgi:hypothetical protein